MVFKIRPASAEDAPACTRIAQAAYAPYVADIGRRPMPMEADFAAQIAEGKVWVATMGDVAGYVVVYPTEGTAWMLENIAVDPSHHGKGLGGALIAHAENTAQAAGAEAIELYTNAKMTANLSLYPALGYLEMSRGKQDGFERVFFRKTL